MESVWGCIKPVSLRKTREIRACTRVSAVYEKINIIPAAQIRSEKQIRSER
jgi:hypothetical protein